MNWDGLGTKVQPALLARHAACAFAPEELLEQDRGCSSTNRRGFICVLASAQRKGGEVVRGEEWSRKDRLNEGLFSLEKKQHRGGVAEASKIAEKESRDHLIHCGP